MENFLAMEFLRCMIEDESVFGEKICLNLCIFEYGWRWPCYLHDITKIVGIVQWCLKKIIRQKLVTLTIKHEKQTVL